MPSSVYRSLIYALIIIISVPMCASAEDSSTTAPPELPCATDQQVLKDEIVSAIQAEYRAVNNEILAQANFDSSEKAKTLTLPPIKIQILGFKEIFCPANGGITSLEGRALITATNILPLYFAFLGNLEYGRYSKLSTLNPNFLYDWTIAPQVRLQFANRPAKIISPNSYELYFSATRAHAVPRNSNWQFYELILPTIDEAISALPITQNKYREIFQLLGAMASDILRFEGTLPEGYKSREDILNTMRELHPRQYGGHNFDEFIDINAMKHSLNGGIDILFNKQNQIEIVLQNLSDVDCVAITRMSHFWVPNSLDHLSPNFDNQSKCQGNQNLRIWSILRP